MKKNMMLAVALIIGMGYCSDGMLTMAAQNEEKKTDETVNTYKDYFSEESPLLEMDRDKEFSYSEEIDNDSKEKEEEIESGNLQMPEKFEVIIDPWEVEGKGQIYSEEYVIRNMGDETGILTLSGLICRPNEKSGAVIRTNRDRIREDKRKSVYMEMLIGTGERIPLSETESVYETEIKPGEKLTVQFTGEVNEYASEGWKNGDVSVGVIYSWDRKEEIADVSGDADDTDDKEIEKMDTSGDVLSEESEKSEVSGDASSEIDDLAVDNGMTDVKTVELKSQEEKEIEVDSWTADENGQNAEIWYILQNTGKNSGTIRLSDLTYKGSAQEGTIVRMKQDSAEDLQEKLNFEEIKFVSVEVTSEEKDNFSIEQESQETSEYETKLKPGEALIICFVSNLDGREPEGSENGETAVTIKYSWILEEDVPWADCGQI